MTHDEYGKTVNQLDKLVTQACETYLVDPLFLRTLQKVVNYAVEMLDSLPTPEQE